MQDHFGPALKEWRQIRRLSQMELGLSAGVSPRHISFLETGRSRPSRGMLLRLCDELQVPGGARNQLLTAAGMAPAYHSRSLDDDDIAPLSQAVNWMLQSHAPFPAMALDRHWRLADLNGPAAMMLGAAGLKKGDSLIDGLIGNEALRAAIDNLEEVEAHTLMRLRTELAFFGRDPVLESAIAALHDRVGRQAAGRGVMPAVIPARYRLGDTVLSFFSTIAQFGSTGDVAMSELRIEHMFPADEDTRVAMVAMSAQ